jgi:hypothetical protein
MPTTSYQRPILATLQQRLTEPRRFIQVLAGPRQTGKTTLIHQALAAANLPATYATADAATLRGPGWIDEQWHTARARIAGAANGGVLVLDEVQKIPGWSDEVKRLWDEDELRGVPLRVVLLGSAPLLVQQGLAESLAGRFELIRIPHWSFAEMREAFGFSLEQYVYFGAYPGAAALIHDEDRWRSYLLDALIETSISRDVLLMTRVDKPALLRRLFDLACRYSGQVLAYQKMLGQLQDAGNTVTLAHYLRLLEGAGLVAGLPKHAGQQVRQRASSPKLLALNTALMSATSDHAFAAAHADRSRWGRLVESCVGAALSAGIQGTAITLAYWAARSHEVDFVLARGDGVLAIEVKSGRRREALPGLEAFAREFPGCRRLLVGEPGVPLEEFLLAPPAQWLS